MTHQMRLRFHKRLLDLLKQISGLRMELDHELTLGRHFDRVSLILSGWEAELVGLMDDVAYEIETTRRDEEKS